MYKRKKEKTSKEKKAKLFITIHDKYVIKNVY